MPNYGYAVSATLIGVICEFGVPSSNYDQVSLVFLAQMLLEKKSIFPSLWVGTQGKLNQSRNSIYEIETSEFEFCFFGTSFLSKCTVSLL